MKPDWPALLDEAQKIVKGKMQFKRWIDGTPLANDIAVWMADFVVAVAPLIAAREREACAQISFDEYLAASHDDEDPQNHDLVARFRSQGGADSANRIYAAIRARGGEG